MLLTVVVHGANVHDSKAAYGVTTSLKDRFSRLSVIFADGGYRGELVEWVKQTYKWTIQIVLPNPDARGFEVLPKRWVVERTFAWFESYRRLQGL
ncbi:MAG: transposase [Bacteroidetes bacterium]|nr:transposase [Bacteroidota bacterium]